MVGIEVSDNREGGGMMIRGKACENAWYVTDSIRKVSTVGHLGEKRSETSLPLVANLFLIIIPHLLGNSVPSYMAHQA